MQVTISGHPFASTARPKLNNPRDCRAWCERLRSGRSALLLVERASKPLYLDWRKFALFADLPLAQRIARSLVRLRRNMKYKDAKVCVTGKITSHREKPEIIATEPSQIVEER